MPSISFYGDGIAYECSPGLINLGIRSKSYFVCGTSDGTKAFSGKRFAATVACALICALSLTACGGGDTSACSDENFRPPVSVLVNENNEITSYGPAYNRAASIALLQGVWVNAYYGVLTISEHGSFSIDPSIELGGVLRSIGYLLRYEGTMVLINPKTNLYAVTRRAIVEVAPGSARPPFPSSADDVVHYFVYLSDSACGKTNDLLFHASTERLKADSAFRREVQ
jgi:hypothetical protein